jgi:hypothetical protein
MFEFLFRLDLPFFFFPFFIFAFFPIIFLFKYHSLSPPSGPHKIILRPAGFKDLDSSTDVNM